MTSITIGQLASRAQVGIETIRFYERKGLILDPPRSEAGYRQYPTDTVARIRFIKRAQNLGFPLSEIMELLSLQNDPESSCNEIRVRAEIKIEDIENKIAALYGMKKALTELTVACRERSTLEDCPFIDRLYQEDTN